MSGSFFDTNVVLQLALGPEERATTVQRLLVDGGTISVQVLNEIANVSRKKYRKPWTEVRAFLADTRERFTVIDLDLRMHEAGIGLAERHGFSTYDAMIVAAALSSGCDTLWSEDMQHGMVVDKRLTIRNPFATG